MLQRIYIKKKHPEVIQELGLNLESRENSKIKQILQELKFGKIKQDVAFARIKQECPNSEVYNDAEISIRIGKRCQKVRWNEFDSIMGNHDITVRLHEKFKVSHDFIGSLTQLSDEYYDSIVAEENGDAE